jgi:non-specific protein-tyrosine kinase
MKVSEIIEKKKAERLAEAGGGKVRADRPVEGAEKKRVRRKPVATDAPAGESPRDPWDIRGALGKVAGLLRRKGPGHQAPAAEPQEQGTPAIRAASPPPTDPGGGPGEKASRTSPTVPPVDGKKIGWVSPAYTVSRAVALDPATVTGNRCVAFLPESPEADAYRVLRTRILQRIKELGGNTVMVTSALPGEGKTLTAINLAMTFAREFRQTVLLVDCDLKRQKIHDYLGYDGERGLIDYLLYDTPIPELMVWPGIEKLTVISGGRTIGDSSELIGSQRMKDMVEDMRTRYPDRIVFFDVPPVLAGADALAFAPLVDHILFAVQAGRTPLPEIRSALGLLPAEKVAGLVLNRQQSPPPAYYPRIK